MAERCGGTSLYWLLVGGFIPSQTDLSTELRVLLRHGRWLPLEQVVQETKVEGANVCYDLALKTTHCHFFSIPLWILVSLGSVWEGNTRGQEYQEVKTIGGYVAGWIQ